MEEVKSVIVIRYETYCSCHCVAIEDLFQHSFSKQAVWARLFERKDRAR